MNETAFAKETRAREQRAQHRAEILQKLVDAEPAWKKNGFGIPGNYQQLQREARNIQRQ